jgi:hypothetical protein
VGSYCSDQAVGSVCTDSRYSITSRRFSESVPTCVDVGCSDAEPFRMESGKWNFKASLNSAFAVRVSGYEDSAENISKCFSMLNLEGLVYRY